MTDEAAMILILEEVKKARRKHPKWFGSEKKEDVLFASAVVCEESGELIRAAVQYYNEGGDAQTCFIEAMQTGAMCVRFLTGK